MRVLQELAAVFCVLALAWISLALVIYFDDGSGDE